MSTARSERGFHHQLRTVVPTWIAVAACAFAFAPTALAQGDEPDEAVVQQARDLYSQGSEHARNGDWKRAYVSLKLSFELVRHWSTAASLGQCELELGRFADAATHLEYASRALPLDAEQREHVEAMLKRARAHVAGLVVQVNLNGATVSVDGDTIGKSPLSVPVFVAPGVHVVAASVNGRPAASQRLAVDAGEGRTITLAIGVAPAPPASPTESPTAPAPAVPRRDSDEQESSSKWIVLGTGTGLTVLAAGTAVLFRHRASSAESDADVIRDEVGTNGCYQPTGALVGKCEDLRGLIDDRNDNERYSASAWVSAGVLGAATVATWLLWPGESKVEPAVGASLTPAGFGVSTRGRF